MAYVCLLEARLHVHDSGSLKEKRRLVRSLKDGVRKRFGAAVAEVDGHDTWQRATLLFALVGGAEVEVRADRLQGFIEARCPDGCSFERQLRTLEDLKG